MSPTDLRDDWLGEYPKPNTRDAYQRDVTDYFAWCQGRKLDPLKPDRPDVTAYRNHLLSLGLEPQTVDRKMNACRSFFRYLNERGILRESPFGHVRPIATAGDSVTPWLDTDGLGRLLDVARESHDRDFLLVALLGLNGLRVSEAIGADVTDLGRSGGHRTLNVDRKGSKAGVVPLAPQVCDVLDPYLDGREEGPLLVRVHRSGKIIEPVAGISRQAAWDIVKKLVAVAAIDVDLSPHGLRHSFITQALEQSELHVVQDAAGHASPATTQRYNRGRFNLDLNPTFRLAEGLVGGGR